MDIKTQLMSGAMKAMQSDTARKVMASPQFQNAMASALRTAFKVRNRVDNTKKSLASAFSVATTDEVRELRRSVDRLERRLFELH